MMDDVCLDGMCGSFFTVLCVYVLSCGWKVSPDEFFICFDDSAERSCLFSVAVPHKDASVRMLSTRPP